MSVTKENMLRWVENREDEPADVVLQNIKEVIDDLVFCHVTELEDSLRFVVPAIIRIMQKIYTKNNVMVQSNKGTIVDIIRTNFQVALNLMDISNDILQSVMKTANITFSTIPSVPVNLAHILFLTFEHFKNGQKMYSSHYQDVTEIVDLFRKTQEVHSRFLNFLGTNLTIDFSNESEIIAYREILDIILKISKTLSGINHKSMADNWKSFIALVQKSSGCDVTLFNLSPAIQILTEEINSNLVTISEVETSDLKKASQSFKIAGFLVKVVLKLFETNLNVADHFEDILTFWIMIYSWHGGFFQTNGFAEEIVNPVNNLYNLCTESLPDLLFRNCEFFNQFCSLHGNFLASKRSFGFLMFAIALMKELPKLLKNEPEAFTNFSVVSLLRSVFSLTRNCYMEYFNDHNSDFYEDFIIHVSIVILLFPDHFSEIENMLLDCVLDDNMWAALVAIDVWSLTLRYASEDVCRSTLATLINNIENLKAGTFQQTPLLERLKVFAQRIFKTLSDSARNEEITKYNPNNNMAVWKILNLRNIPMSHRYYIEFLLCDISDKMDFIKETNCSVSSVVALMENLGTLSYTNFGDLHINATRLVPLIMRLWSFDMSDVSSSNIFFKYFVYKLVKVTIAVSGELSGENFILVLSQLRVLQGEILHKLLTCAVLQSMTRRNFINFHEKNTLSTLMSSLFQLLLADKNAVVVQSCLESFIKISNSNNYENVVHKVSNCSLDVKQMTADYIQRRASGTKYGVKYFHKIRSFTYQHKCCEWTNAHQPAYKKIRVDNDVNVVINNLCNETEKLRNMLNKIQLNERQRIDLKDVINKLEILSK